MNNNLRTERAILGVFDASGYIDVGTAESSCPYAPGKDSRDACKGKQFIVQTPKLGKLPSLFYEKEHPYVGKDLPYVDRTRFKEEQNKPPTGFYSSDFMRRGEFTSTIRTEQYRDLLKHKDRQMRRALKQLKHAAQDNEAFQNMAHIQPVPSAPEIFLFDLVYDDGSKLDRMTASKLPRDTMNKTALTKERKTGPVCTTMQTAHAHPGAVQKASHGHRPVIETTFYRKANAFLLS